MFSTFNAFGSASKEIGKISKPIWLGNVAPHTVGGVLAEKYRIAGALYEAGTPVNLTDGVLKPFLAFKVVSLTAGETNDTVVVYGAKLGDVIVAPSANDVLQKLGASFSATTKAAKVIAVTPQTGADAGKFSFTVAHSATFDALSAGDYLVYSASTSAGSGKAVADQPNGYLYNDIYLGDLSNPNATGAVVDFHGEGIIIDFTPAADFAAAMKVAVPNVIQHTFPEGAFVTV